MLTRREESRVSGIHLVHCDAFHLAVLKPRCVEGISSRRPGMQPLAEVVCAKPDADDNVSRDGDIDVKWHHALLQCIILQSWLGNFKLGRPDKVPAPLSKSNHAPLLPCESHCHICRPAGCQGSESDSWQACSPRRPDQLLLIMPNNMCHELVSTVKNAIACVW